MTRKKLAKLWREVSAARRSQAKAADLERLAKSAGRKKVTARGKEPMWVSVDLELFPISIPHHGGKDIAVGTKNSILDALEDDLHAWEKRIDEEDAAHNGNDPD